MKYESIYNCNKVNYEKLEKRIEKYCDKELNNDEVFETELNVMLKLNSYA